MEKLCQPPGLYTPLPSIPPLTPGNLSYSMPLPQQHPSITSSTAPFTGVQCCQSAMGRGEQLDTRELESIANSVTVSLAATVSRLGFEAQFRRCTSC